MKRVAGVVMALCILATGSAWARIDYGPAVLDDATVLEARTYELSLAGSFSDAAGDVIVLEAGLEYGVTERIQVGASLPWVSFDGDAVSVDGIGDLVISGKVCLMGGPDAAADVSAELGIVMDTGDDDIVGPDNDIDYGVRVAATKEFDTWNGHLNIMYVDPGEDIAEEVISYGVAAEMPLDTVAVIVELEASDETMPLTDDDPMDLYLAVRKPLDMNADISGVIGYGLSDASPDWAIGVVYRRAF